MQGANGPDWGARVHGASVSRWRRVSAGLATDWIDLYQLHTPDPNTPIAETLAALTELVTEGKVRYLGSSNLAGWQVIDAGRPRPTAWRRSSRRRTNTRGWTGRSSRNWCRRSNTRG